MNLEKWLNQLDYTVSFEGQEGSPENYRGFLKEEIESINLGDGLIHIYPKIDKNNIINELYLFSPNEVSIISFGEEVIIQDISFDKLLEVQYRFNLNSRLDKGLLLKFHHTEILLDLNKDYYNGDIKVDYHLIKEIYKLVNNYL